MKPRVALLADHLEEGWASMDLCAAMLARHLGQSGRVDVSLVRPGFHHRLGRLPWLFGPRHGRTLDRYLNRYLDYPRAVADLRGFDVYHVLDQAYAHVGRRLPAGRTVVTCHDVDFVSPPAGTRHAWLVRQTGALSLPGLRSAARVICVSEVTRQELQRRGLVEPDRLTVIPDGVEDEFRPDGTTALAPGADALLLHAGAGPLVLHVGAMNSRKRIDLVLRTFALARRSLPGAVLVRAGGVLSPALRSLAANLGLEGAVISMPFLSRADLAALYRRAHVFLLCSENEGFGLPVLEAMASGLPVVSRDLAAVREVAGDAARLVSGQEPEAFAAAVTEVLRDEGVRGAMRRAGLERAARYRWSVTAERTEQVYREVLDSLPPGAARP